MQYVEGLKVQVEDIENKLVLYANDLLEAQKKLETELVHPSSKNSVRFVRRHIERLQSKVAINQRLKKHLNKIIGEELGTITYQEEKKAPLVARKAARLRETGCDGKVGHNSHYHACKALAAMQQEGVTGTLHPYKCLFCTRWHLGNQKK